MPVALARGPLRKIGVDALAVQHQRREQRDLAAAILLHEARRDHLLALRLDRDLAIGTVLRAELDEEQSQKVMHLGERAHRGLAAAAARALLDRYRRRDAEDRVHVGPRGRLHELARIGVERLEVAALALVEQDVEGERGLARARDAGDHGEAPARDVDVDVLEVVLARVVDADHVAEIAPGGFAYRGKNRDGPYFFYVLAQRLPGVRGLVRHHLRWRALAHELAAGAAALRPEIEDPVGAADDIEVVLDDDERMAGIEQLPERAQELRHVVEVQAGRRFIEEEELGVRACLGVGEVASELQALRLAARERRHRLAELEIVQPDIDQRLQALDHLGMCAKEARGLRNRHVEHVGDRLAA